MILPLDDKTNNNMLSIGWGDLDIDIRHVPHPNSFFVEPEQQSTIEFPKHQRQPRRQRHLPYYYNQSEDEDDEESIMITPVDDDQQQQHKKTTFSWIDFPIEIVDERMKTNKTKTKKKCNLVM